MDEGLRSRREGIPGYGYDELGHALEAAALGIPYDQPELGVKRDDATANIMSQVIAVVAEDSEYVSDRPGVGDSLAKMGAGYIDDLNWAVSDFGGAGYNTSTRDAAFQHSEGLGHVDVTSEARHRSRKMNPGEQERQDIVIASNISGSEITL